MGDRSYSSFTLYACPDDLLAAVSTTLEEFGYIGGEYNWQTRTSIPAEPLTPADVPDLFQQDETRLSTANDCGEALAERLGDRLAEVVFAIDQAPYDGADGTIVYNTPENGLAFFDSGGEVVVAQSQIDAVIDSVFLAGKSTLRSTLKAKIDRLYGKPWQRELIPYEKSLADKWAREREALNARSATITPTTLQEI